MEKSYKETLIESVIRINKNLVKESCKKVKEQDETEETSEEKEEETETNE